MSGEPSFTLAALGWGEPFASGFAALAALAAESGEGWVPARVVGQLGSYRVATGEAELPAEPAGRLKREPGGEPRPRAARQLPEAPARGPPPPHPD